jgi:hypothetical protein
LFVWLVIATDGPVVSTQADVAWLGELDTIEVLGTSSDVFKAKKYVVAQLKPVTVKFWTVPAVSGAGSPLAWVAVLQLASVI